MDLVIYEFFGGCSDPLEMAVRMFIVILVFDGIFGTIGILLSSFTNRH